MNLPNVVRFDDGRILTRNLAPGQRVYGEELHTVQGEEFRAWDPTRSKLGAYLVKGGRELPLSERSIVLYLGAANGTTVSHVSDMVRDGVVVAVEFSPRSFRDLLRMSDPRENVAPVLADAWRPELYERYLGRIDLLFQDIAQRQQAAIFAKNILRFKPAWAMIAVKARSVDVAAHPRDVYNAVAEEVSALTGYDVVEMVELGPFEKDHAALVLRPGSGKPRAAQAQAAQKRDVRADTRGAPPAREERARDDRPRFAPKGGAPPPRKFEKRDRDDRPRGGGGGGRPGFGGGGGGGGGYRRDDRPRDDRPRGGGGGGDNRRGWR